MAQEKKTIWMVSENWTVDEEAGHSVRVFASKEGALNCLRAQIEEDANEGCIDLWQFDKNYKFERTDTSFECWLDGDWCCNHYTVCAKEIELLP